jgi:group I intron endonuclease
MSESRKGINNPLFGKKHTKETISKMRAVLGTAIVTNLKTNKTTEYSSIREAARTFNCSDMTIAKYMKNSVIFKESYLISAKVKP